MTKKLQIESDHLEQDLPKPSSTKNPDTPSPEQSNPLEELNKLSPGQFIPAELIMKILRHNTKTNLVRLKKINFDTEQDPEPCSYSNSSMPQNLAHPKDTYNTPQTTTNFHNKNQKNHDSNQQEKPVITVTEVQNRLSTNPPPSYMERDTNRPPSKKDFKILATYLAKKKIKNRK